MRVRAIALLAWAAIAIGSVAHSQVETRAESRLARMKQSVNYDAGRFVNAVPTDQIRLDGLGSTLKAKAFPNDNRRPSIDPPTVPLDRSRFGSGNRLQAVWLGHSTVLVSLDGLVLLIDPILEEAVEHAVGSTPRFGRVPVSRVSLPPVDVVLISHDHPDHLERGSVDFFADRGAAFVVPLGVGMYLEDWQVPDSQIVELDWWESAEFGSLTLTCTPARHWSGRRLTNINRTLWRSWVIAGNYQRLYYGGDTGFSEHFKEIGARFGPFDLTLLPIGAYGEAWPDIHIGPEEAVVAHQALRGELLLPVHWATFDLAVHPWAEPIDRLLRAAVEEEVAIVTP